MPDVCQRENRACLFFKTTSMCYSEFTDVSFFPGPQGDERHVTILAHDTHQFDAKWEWMQKRSYRWHITHRPTGPRAGLIRVEVHTGHMQFNLSVHDSTLKGGRLGPYCLSQVGWWWTYYCTSQAIVSIHHLFFVHTIFYNYNMASKHQLFSLLPITIIDIIILMIAGWCHLVSSEVPCQ